MNVDKMLMYKTYFKRYNNINKDSFCAHDMTET